MGPSAFLGLWPPFSNLKPATENLSDPASILTSLSESLPLSPSSTFQKLCDYRGSTQIIQASHPVSQLISNFNFTCKLNFLLPQNLIYARVPAIRTWACLGGIILPTTGKNSFYVITLFKNLVNLLLTKESLIFLEGNQNPNMMKHVIPFTKIITRKFCNSCGRAS